MTLPQFKKRLYAYKEAVLAHWSCETPAELHHAIEEELYAAFGAPQSHAAGLGDVSGKVSREDGLFVFRIEGKQFDQMPLGRVATYMAHVATMAGPGAYFHKMTARTIQFRGQRRDH